MNGCVVGVFIEFFFPTVGGCTKKVREKQNKKEKNKSLVDGVGTWRAGQWSQQDWGCVKLVQATFLTLAVQKNARTFEFSFLGAAR